MTRLDLTTRIEKLDKLFKQTAGPTEATDSAASRPFNQTKGSDPGSVMDAALTGISSEIVRTVDRPVKAWTPPEMRNRLNKLLHVRFIRQKAVPY